MTALKTILSLFTLAIFIAFSSCTDPIIDDIIPDNAYDQSITWSGYYGTGKLNPFSGAFNEVSFKFDNEIDGQLYGAVIENTNLSQLSLQLLSIKIKNAAIGNYDLKDAAVGSIKHYKDFNKKTEFTSINNGTLAVINSLNKDEIKGNFNGWGLSGNDTLFLTGTFNRNKK